MKKLTKVRLINWHYFANETIYIRNNTLITGQNATGKSTIVDAIAFVITAGDQIFNLAANEKSKRDLKGYVKCKLGIDNHEYLREGDVTGHVALEFYDETKDEYFSIGTVIDAFGELLPPKVIFYELAGQITDGQFVSPEGEILTTVTFKKSKVADKVFLTRREAKLSYRSLFGSINETYFSLLPKALAFKPIADVKDFIYHYLLEEKVLDVESIKESIHAYRDLEATLKIIKQKVSDLKEMKDLYEDIQKNQEHKQFLEYFLKVIDLESTKSVITQKSKLIDKINFNRDKNKGLITEIDHQIDLLDERSREIYSMLQSDSTFKADELYDKEILGLTSKIDEQEEIKRYFIRRVEKVKPLIQELKTEYPKKVYDDLSKIDLLNLNESNFEKAKLSILEISKTLQTLTDDNTKESGRLEEIKKTLVVEINDIYQTLKDLENHKLRYNPMIQKLKTKIEDGLKERFGIDISVHVLAELLEVTDPKWHDTVEDYLGQQRFNLIVEPRYFDEALQVYNKIKDSLNIYGIGLVNTKKIQHFTTFQPKSLASIITSDNVDAVHYVNMVVGSLIMVDQVTNLENYPQAITNTGMVYRSFTVRSLNRNTEKPFIGKRAGELQLEKWRNMALTSKTKYNEVNNQIILLNEENKAISSLSLPGLFDMLEASMSLSVLKEKRKVLVQKKQTLPKENINDIRVEYENIKNEIKGYNNNRRKLYEENGKLSSDELKAQEELLALETKMGALRLEMSLALETAPSIESDAYNLYHQEIENAKDSKKVEQDYLSRIALELTNISNLEDSLKSKQFKYVNNYNLSYQYGLEYMNLYLDELNKLIKSDLVKYESKVREAREVAEKLFKEDFIAKLRNYIVSAQEEIKKINLTLASIHFGEDVYEFIFPKSKEFGDYYEMVLSDESMRTGGEIFNYDFETKYQRQLEELFINLASEDLNSNGA
ncbi:MAG: ATP-binding protein, partial [Candidatus Izemoplasmatales bacterium]|nr:ATP-binding protein [Candidatus Izemoplasmatales bacterium]